MSAQKLIVAVTGATGTIFGIRLLELLQGSEVETHLVMSKWARRTLLYETKYSLEEVQAMASEVYPLHDQGATISSGSFITSGMVVIPCSMKTLSAIAHGHGDNLIHRAADVILKERRRLSLVVRESPFNEIHLENMLKLARMGAIIMPPVPAFYNHPRDLDDIVNHVVGRVLDQFEIHLDTVKRWRGMVSVHGEPSTTT